MSTAYSCPVCGKDKRDLWTRCYFVGKPPAGYTSWQAFIDSDVKMNVEIKAWYGETLCNETCTNQTKISGAIIAEIATTLDKLAKLLSELSKHLN